MKKKLIVAILGIVILLSFQNCSNMKFNVDSQSVPSESDLSGQETCDIKITSMPQPQTVVSGQIAEYSVTATSSKDLSYQWKLNGTSILGARTDTYMTSNVSVDDNNKQYSVDVMSADCQTSSTSAVLHVFSDSTLSSLSEHVVVASDTDVNIDTSFGNHYVYLSSEVSLKGKLFVFFPASGGKPMNNKQVIQAAARNGYHSIGLAYENGDVVALKCQSSSDPDCAGKIREETYFGTDASDIVSVNAANSVQNRLVKTLLYLHSQYPTEGWNQFLGTGQNILWDKITVSGHSQGGGLAGYIAMKVAVARMCAFSSPADYDNKLDQPAKWMYGTSATPTNRYYGFSHMQDPIVPWVNLQKIWPRLGMDGSGASVSVDTVSFPFNSSQMLSTNMNYGAGGPSYHGITATDSALPLDANGLPIWLSVWQYICFL